MTFKHLIFGGGGAAGLIMYGSLKYLNKNDIWNRKDIESIYASSIGTWLALMVLVDLDWDWIDDFIIKRPWGKINKYFYSRLFKNFKR